MIGFLTLVLAYGYRHFTIATKGEIKGANLHVFYILVACACIQFINDLLC